MQVHPHGSLGDLRPFQSPRGISVSSLAYCMSPWTSAVMVLQTSVVVDSPRRVAKGVGKQQIRDETPACWASCASFPVAEPTTGTICTCYPLSTVPGTQVLNKYYIYAWAGRGGRLMGNRLCLMHGFQTLYEKHSLPFLNIIFLKNRLT